MGRIHSLSSVYLQQSFILLTSTDKKTPNAHMTETGHSDTNSTLDQEEVARFSAMADEWWDPHGKFRPLHQINPVRLSFIRDAICAHFGRDAAAPRVLEGLTIADIGCGGGLLCEPMARLGATVTGLDPAQKSIEAARIHAQAQGLDINYRAVPAETLRDEGTRFDVVFCHGSC